MAKPHDTQDLPTGQEQPMVKELLAELHGMDEKARMEIRFYEIIAGLSHIETISQCESMSV
jgi:hypothetical protein